MHIMTLKMKFIQDPRLEFFEKKSSRLINILLLILFYIIGSTILSAIGCKNGHLLDTHKNLSVCKTSFSRPKKPDITGLRICIALCIHTGRAFYLVNKTLNSILYNLLNYNQLHYGKLKLFQECGKSGIYSTSPQVIAERIVSSVSRTAVLPTLHLSAAKGNVWRRQN